jgi:hypothetical protein
MKRLVSAVALAAAVTMLPNPIPADAAVVRGCLDREIASCDEDFPGASPDNVAIRGWCYIIRTAICEIFG